MEIHIRAQVKPVFQSIAGNAPAPRNAGLHLQAIVELNQSVEQTIHRPDVVLGAGKSRVEGSDGIVLIVAKGRAGIGGSGLFSAGKQAEEAKDVCETLEHGANI